MGDGFYIVALIMYVLISCFFRVFSTNFFLLKSSMEMWLPEKTMDMVSWTTIFWPLWPLIRRHYQKQLDAIPGYVERMKQVDQGE